MLVPRFEQLHFYVDTMVLTSVYALDQKLVVWVYELPAEESRTHNVQKTVIFQTV